MTIIYPYSKLYNNALAWFLYKGNELPAYLLPEHEVPRHTIDVVHNKRTVSIDTEDYELFISRGLSWDDVLSAYTNWCKKGTSPLINPRRRGVAPPRSR